MIALRPDEAELFALKDYMKLDTESSREDETVCMMWVAARQFILGERDAPEGYEELYRMAVWSLTLHYYDHRDSTGTETPIPNGLDPIIKLLRRIAAVPGQKGAQSNGAAT